MNKISTALLYKSILYWF